MELADAKALFKRFSDQVPSHTDILLALSQPQDGKSGCRGVGSGVHVTYCGRHLTITCSHVAKHDCLYFSNPKGLRSPQIPDGEHPLVSNISLLVRSERDDIAVLDSAHLPITAHGKSRYDLAKSLEVTKELLSSPELNGLAGYTYGVWGSQTSGFIYPDGLAYMQVITYSGIGPITAVSDDTLIVDLSEKDDLREGEPALDRIRDIQPTGGYRDISGCSGCGLWIMKDQPRLAGILLAPERATRSQHPYQWQRVVLQDDHEIPVVLAT